MAASPAGTADTSDSLRVLVVDDEPNIVDGVCMGLRHHGYRAQSVACGADSLGVTREWHPHAMLDVMLPDMGGFDIARRLAAQRSNVPILFLSARDNTADKVLGLELGGDDYLTKPFSIEELVARLRVIMRRSDAIAQAPEPLRFADLAPDEDLRVAPFPSKRPARRHDRSRP